MVQSSLKLAANELSVVNATLQEMAGLTDLSNKESQSYIAVSNGLIGSAQQNLNEIQTRSAETNKHYTWFQNRYAMLKSDYDTAFGLAVPQTQERAQ